VIHNLRWDEPGERRVIASKHRGDQALAALILDWLVLRPGLVYSTHGAYGARRCCGHWPAFRCDVCYRGDGMQKLRPLAD